MYEDVCYQELGPSAILALNGRRSVNFRYHLRTRPLATVAIDVITLAVQALATLLLGHLPVA